MKRESRIMRTFSAALLAAFAVATVAGGGGCDHPRDAASRIKEVIFGPDKRDSPNPDPPDFVGPRNWKVFMAGVDEYDPNEGTSRLSYCRKDAQDLESCFVSCGVPKENIVRLTESRDGERKDYIPTKANLEKRFDKFLRSLHAGDFAIVFLSGHGFSKDGEQFYVPLDFKRGNQKGTSFSIKNAAKRLKESAASNCWFLVDACRNELKSKDYSARGMEGGEDGYVDGIDFAGLADIFESPHSKEINARALWSAGARAGISVLFCSCQDGNTSQERDELENGAFTWGLLQTLGEERNDADEDGDGQLSIVEIMKHVSSRTSECTGGAQKPEWRGDADFDLKLVKWESSGLSHFKQAQELARAERFDEAEKEIERAIELEPENEEYRSFKTKIANYVEAAALAENAIDKLSDGDADGAFKDIDEAREKGSDGKYENLYSVIKGLRQDKIDVEESLSKRDDWDPQEIVDTLQERASLEDGRVLDVETLRNNLQEMLDQRRKELDTRVRKAKSLMNEEGASADAVKIILEVEEKAFDDSYDDVCNEIRKQHELIQEANAYLDDGAVDAARAVLEELQEDYRDSRLLPPKPWAPRVMLEERIREIEAETEQNRRAADAKAAYERAERLFNDGDFNGALKALEPAIGNFPNEKKYADLKVKIEQGLQNVELRAKSEAAYKRAEGEYDARKLDSALESIQLAIRNFPNEKKYSDLKSKIEKAIRAVDLSRKAEELVRTKEYSSAVSCLEDAVELEPNPASRAAYKRRRDEIKVLASDYQRMPLSELRELNEKGDVKAMVEIAYRQINGSGEVARDPRRGWNMLGKAFSTDSRIDPAILKKRFAAKEIRDIAEKFESGDGVKQDRGVAEAMKTAAGKM